MHALIRQLAALLPVLMLVAACSSDDEGSVRMLDQRLRSQLAGDIEANRASVQQVPGGDRVILLDNGVYRNSTDAMDGRERDPRASVIEALLDPQLMQVQVADVSTLPDERRDARLRNVVDYFTANGVPVTPVATDPWLTTAAGSSAPVVPGVAITINVVCPNRDDGSGYGSGRRKPGCY